MTKIKLGKHSMLGQAKPIYRYTAKYTIQEAKDLYNQGINMKEFAERYGEKDE